MRISGLTKPQQREIYLYMKAYRYSHNLNLRLTGDRHEKLKMHKSIRFYVGNISRKLTAINMFMLKASEEI